MFFKKNLVNNARENFLSNFPNSNDADNFWNKFPNVTDLVNERFTVEYEIEHFVDEFNIEREWKKTVYSIESEISKIFKAEYEKSKIFLLEKFEIFTEYPNKKSFKNKKNLGDALKDILNNVLFHLDKISNNNYSDALSKAMESPLHWIVLFLYNRFSSALPKAEGNLKLLEIINSEISIKEKLDIKILKPDTAEEFFKLKDRTGERILLFEDSIQDLLNFSLFCKGEISEIKKPIKFKSNLGAANYLIGKITKKLSLNRSKIEEKKIITLGDGNFIADICNTEFSRFPNNNKEWSDLIDNTFRNCLI